MHRILKPNRKLLITVYCKTQPEKTKRSFSSYGDNYIPWKAPGFNNENKIKTQIRYYYIFELDKIKELFEKIGFTILKSEWEHGNEIFILSKK